MTTYRHTFPEPIPADTGVRFLLDAGRNAIIGIEWDVPEEPGPIGIRQRSPEEIRARLPSPSSPLPRELAESLTDELTPAGHPGGKIVMQDGWPFYDPNPGPQS